MLTENVTFCCGSVDNKLIKFHSNASYVLSQLLHVAAGLSNASSGLLYKTNSKKMQ